MTEFTTSKKDMKKGVSRIPLEMARIKSEDIQDNNSAHQSNLTQSERDDFDYSHNMDERENAYHNNRIPILEMDKEFTQIL